MSNLALQYRGRGAASAPPTPDLQLRVGAETLAGVGFAVTGTSITSGNSAGHWQITSGKICVSSAGQTASLNAGPYTLTMSDGQVVAIAIDADAFDVTTQAEYDAAFPLAAAGPTAGKTIYLNPGIAYALGMGEFDHPAFEKYYTARDFEISARGSGRVAITDDVWLRGGNITFSGLERLLLSASPFAIYANSTFEVSDITWNNCRFEGIPADPYGDYSAGIAGWGNDFEFLDKQNPQYKNFTFTDCHFRYMRRMIVLSPNEGFVTITGGTLSDYWSQGINLSRRALSTAVPVFTIDGMDFCRPIGKASDALNPHPDAVIVSLTKEALADIEVHIDNNTFRNGGSRGNDIGFNCRDGVQGGVDSGMFFTGTANGNTISAVDASELLLVENAKSFISIGNTVVCQPGATLAGQYKIGSITTSGVHTIQQNLYETAVFGGSPTLSSNLAMGAYGETNAYADVFVGTDWASVTKETQQQVYRNKAGGPADLAGAGSIPA